MTRRTGLVTAHLIAGKLKTILQKYQELYETILTPDQRAKVVDLIQCLLNFLNDVPQYPTES